MAEMIDFAVAFVKKLPAVIPLGAWTFTSRSGEEVSMWKRALIKNWQNEPLTTEKEVRKFWNDYGRKYRKTPQIGIATGQICGGVIVLDFDRGHSTGVDGYETLLDWQWKTGKKLPETWTALTGSGGYHFYYRTDKAMRCFSNPDLGVDLRADGGYIVVPPSLHPCGKRYEWEVNPGEIECAEADETVLEFIEYCRPKHYEYKSNGSFTASERRGQDEGERKMLLPEVIDEGGRHAPLISLIGTLNRLGVSDESIEALVRSENRLKCNPPLTERELQHEIFPAIFRWPKGVSEDKWLGKEDWKKQMNEQMYKQRVSANVSRYLNEE